MCRWRGEFDQEVAIYAVARLTIWNLFGREKGGIGKHRIKRTSRAHLWFFFTSGGSLALDLSSDATHSCNNSGLSSPRLKQSARSPMMPNDLLMIASVRSSSARHLWTSSRMGCACGRRTRTMTNDVRNNRDRRYEQEVPFSVPLKPVMIPV
jgi:hypothetical protein